MLFSSAAGNRPCVTGLSRPCGNTPTTTAAMAALKALILLGCVSAAFASEALWDGLRVTWSAVAIADIFHLASFYGVPKTVVDAVSEGWVEVADDFATVYCMKDDPRVCLLYDANGLVAGIDVCVLVDDVDDLSVDFDFTAQEMYLKIQRLGQSCYRTRVFWASEDEVKNGRSSLDDGLGSGLWIVDKNDVRQEIPIEQARIESETVFTKQSCIPTMGTHYYYNMSETTDCCTFYPYFLMVDEKQAKVHGIGFQTYGISSKTGRKWFEDVPYIAIKPTIPTAPDCLVDWVKEVGTISLHIYFKESPRSIGC